MSDYSELVKRLRDLTDENYGDLDQFSTWGREMVAAADAIGAQAKRIEELEAEIEAANHVLDLCGIPFHDDNGKKYSLKQRLETRVISKQGVNNE